MAKVHQELFDDDDLKPVYEYGRPCSELSSFVNELANPFDGTSSAPTEDFAGSLEGNRHSSLYNFLGYSSKKPYEPLETYLNYFAKPGHTVLDPFCGSGGVGLVASKTGRHAILIDASPLATLISKGYCTHVDVNEIKSAFADLKSTLTETNRELYETTCHLTDEAVRINAAIWSQTYRCVKCFEVVPLKSAREHKFCPHCDEKISTRQERLGYIPWGVRYRVPGGKDSMTRSIVGPDQAGIEAFRKLDVPNMENQQWDAESIGFIDRPLMNCPGDDGQWGLLWRPYHEDIRNVADFFTRRNLFAIQSILNAIRDLHVSEDVKDLLHLALANVVPSCSVQQRHYPGSTFPNMAMPGVLYVPPINEEINVFDRFLAKQRSLTRGQKAVNDTLRDGRVLISTQDGTDLNAMPGNSIDYVFTDPPDSGRIQYGELNFIQEAILQLDTKWLDDEVIVNECREFTPGVWQARLQNAMGEVFRVLKPGSWVSVCFHDSDPNSWERLQDAMLQVGFVPGTAAGVSSMETGWHTLKMHTSEDITKRDLVVNYQKPLPGKRLDSQLDREPESMTVADRIGAIIEESLSKKPGQTKDHVYDEVVSRLVRESSMEDHDFDSILSVVAEPTGEDKPRWFLREDREVDVDPAESQKEEEAAGVVGDFLKEQLTRNPEIEGIHYSDIFERVVGSVIDRPRRPLQDWLLDFFYKTPTGTYRLPSSDDENAAKEQSRKQGTQRRVKRYISFLEQGVSVPDQERPNAATICEWIRHCKRSGQCEQGKLLYEKGGLNTDELSEELAAAVEEDYQTCVRMIDRGAS